jgi:hypothetical protein
MTNRFPLCFQYLGCVEVFESRGMQVCEEAVKVLKVRNVQQNVKHTSSVRPRTFIKFAPICHFVFHSFRIVAFCSLQRLAFLD